METSLQELTKNKPLPKWMVNHAVFKSITTIEKVFPSIGLANCSELCDIEGNFSFEYAKTVLLAAKSELRQAFDYIERAGAGIEHNVAFKYMGIIEQLDELLVDNLNAFIVMVKGVIELRIPKDIIVDDKVYYKAGISFIDVYRALHREMSYSFGHEIRTVEKLAGYKDFTPNNYSVAKSSIVFASDGVEGLWDIATMSMRGIKSCVRWDGQHKQTLIGSIADPFTGIIYLTSGKNEKLGAKMLKRCLVRFVIDAQQNKPYLLIDRMYPSLDEGVLRVFTTFLSKKVGSKFYVKFGPTLDAKLFEASYIPKSEVIDKLTENTLTYRDTKINIGKKPSKISERRNSNLKIKIHNLMVRLKNKIDIVDLLNKLPNTYVRYGLTEKNRFVFGVIDAYFGELISKMGENVKVSDEASSDEYIKRMCFYWFSNRNELLKGAERKFNSKLNTIYNQVYSLEAKTKSIKPNQLTTLNKAISDVFSKVIKEQVMIILNKDKTPKAAKKKAKTGKKQ